MWCNMAQDCIIWELDWHVMRVLGMCADEYPRLEIIDSVNIRILLEMKTSFNLFIV